MISSIDRVRSSGTLQEAKISSLIDRAPTHCIIRQSAILHRSEKGSGMATIDLRCGTALHGRLTDDRWLEVKCKRRACGHASGKVVLHTIDLHTGKVVKTRVFADPSTQKRRGQNASHHSPASVRSA